MNFENQKAKTVYLNVLKKMSVEDKLRRTCELSDFSKMLFIRGLKKRFFYLSEADFKKELLGRLKKCDNSNF